MAQLLQNKLTGVSTFDTPDSVVNKQYIDDLFGGAVAPVEGRATGLTAGSFYYTDPNYALQANEIDVSKLTTFAYQKSIFRDLGESDPNLIEYNTMNTNGYAISRSGMFFVTFAGTANTYRVFKFDNQTKTFTVVQDIVNTLSQSADSISLNDNFLLLGRTLYRYDGTSFQQQIVLNETGTVTWMTDNFFIINGSGGYRIYKLNLTTNQFNVFYTINTTLIGNVWISPDEKYSFQFGASLQIVNNTTSQLFSVTTFGEIQTQSRGVGVTPDGYYVLLLFIRFSSTFLVAFKESDISANLGNVAKKYVSFNTVYAIAQNGDVVMFNGDVYRYLGNGVWDLTTPYKKIRNKKNYSLGILTKSYAANGNFISNVTLNNVNQVHYFYNDGDNYVLELPPAQNTKKTILVAKNSI